MFLDATLFNGDLSKWDVSSVKHMYGMFWGATFFKRKLCGAAQVHSQVKKTIMFICGHVDIFECLRDNHRSSSFFAAIMI